ncbi:MAG: bacterioferritin (cytochrome b1) [Myxococcota bacterium]|jgi:bacterioferritin (cytochrome b1)
MLLIDKSWLDRARNAVSTAEVIKLLMGAVTLELSTLPPYLTGLFSMKGAQNKTAAHLVLSVAIEEMLHMSLAANTCIAVGGNPTVLKDGLSLSYPGPLPMCVDEGLTVSLKAVSHQQVVEVFMGIERPDTTAPLPGESTVQTASHRTMMQKKDDGFGSIGDFYAAIITSLESLEASGAAPFANPRLERQVDVAKWFPEHTRGPGNGKVFDLESAKAALSTIVNQGEGVQVNTDPIDPYSGEPSLAHYFRFGEIANGHRLIKDDSDPSGWSYTGEAVPLDESNIHNLLPNARVSSYKEGSRAWFAADAFYSAYLRLLRSLDRTFNGEPDALKSALGVMFELKLVARQIVAYPADPEKPDGYAAAPPFQA